MTALPQNNVSFGSAGFVLEVPEHREIGLRALRFRFFRSLSRAARVAMTCPAILWAVLDVALACAGFLLAMGVWPRLRGQAGEIQLAVQGHAFAIAIYGISLLCMNYALGLYDRLSFTSPQRVGFLAMTAGVVAVIITRIALPILHQPQIGRGVLAGALVAGIVISIACRWIARTLARSAKLRVMLIGDRRQFRTLEGEIRRLYSDFYRRPICVQLPIGTDEATSNDRERVLRNAIEQHAPDEIVVADDDDLILDLVRHSSMILYSGCTIRTHLSYCEQLLHQVPVNATDLRGILGHGFSMGRHRTEAAKRVLDMMLSGFGLLIAAPVMLIVASLVKLTSPGPIVYSQVRVGRYGRNFKIYKFRTMRTDAEKNGAVWAQKNDSRVTSIGTILRKSRLDELPQLWNIFIGEMSFVGPRPERPEMVGDLRRQIAHYDLRHLVPPGLTGWAQVRYRYGASVEDARRKLAFDLYYIRHYSPVFDLAICLRTLVAMAKGAR